MYTEEQQFALKNVINLLTTAITEGINNNFIEDANEVNYDLIKANIPLEIILHYDNAIKCILKNTRNRNCVHID